MGSAIRLICLGLLAVASLSVLAASSSAATKQRRFVAWENGRPTLPVDYRRELDCNTSSHVNPRSDAWRCFGRSTVYDPCFENLAEEEFGELFCVRRPWSKSGVFVFSALDYGDKFKRRRRPWGIVLTSGNRCNFLAGATAVSHGRRLNYDCGSGSYLYGTPDRSKPTWRIFAGKTEGRNWHREKIRTVWH
jgi:hypothetical protein